MSQGGEPCLRLPSQDPGVDEWGHSSRHLHRQLCLKSSSPIWAHPEYRLRCRSSQEDQCIQSLPNLEYAHHTHAPMGQSPWW